MTHVVTAEMLYNEVENPQCTECGQDIINGECDCTYNWKWCDVCDHRNCVCDTFQETSQQYQDRMRAEFGRDMESNLVEYGVIDCDAFYGQSYGAGTGQCPECGAVYNCVDDCTGGRL